jgi:23S rRNA pseudouridine2605 synthase
MDRGVLLRMVGGDKQLDPLGRLHLFTLQMAVDAFDRLAQLALGIGLMQAADRDFGRAGMGVTRGEQRWNTLSLGGSRKVDSGLVLAQAHVAQDEVDVFTVEEFKRFFEVVNRRHDFVAGIGQHILVVERGQRLVLYDEDALDDLLALPEQHQHPTMTTPSQRTNRRSVPRPSKQDRTMPAAEAEGDAKQRVAKLLARAGVASRREVERMIAEGRVALNGEKLTTPATLLIDLSGVSVDGKPVRAPAASQLFRFYKPQAVITAAQDPKGRPTIYDRLPPGLPRLMPVGRLDFMTEGLLLLTNDGELKRQLELPRTGVVRTYRARAHGRVTQEQLEELAQGVTIEGVRYGSINANLERRTGTNCWIEMSLTEGKNREVRRVLAYLGMQVARLIRTAYGPFSVDALRPGAVDEVAAGDLDSFRRTLR